jgi:hypothetical protein
MVTALDATLDLLAEIRATPRSARAGRLARLPRSTLTLLAEVAFQQWERDLARREGELEAQGRRIDDLLRRLGGGAR